MTTYAIAYGGDKNEFDIIALGVIPDARLDKWVEFGHGFWSSLWVEFVEGQLEEVQTLDEWWEEHREGGWLDDKGWTDLT